MFKDQDFTISGPPFEVHLSLVDQAAPPIYSRRILIFSRGDAANENAILALKAGLQQTVNEIPILAGQMGLTAAGWAVKKGVALLRVRNVDSSYFELQSSNFSEVMLSADVLSSVPVITDADVKWNACRIQANFIRGGLLLVISIHHSVMDGHGITNVIEALARNCRTTNVSESSLSPVIYDRSQLSDCKGNGDITKLHAYSVVHGTPALRSVPKNIVTTSFRLSVTALKALKIAASPKNGWVTTHDALNALCWIVHARGRYKAKYITEEDIARFAFPVEFRKLLPTPLPTQYIGNAVLMTKVELPVKTLLGPGGLSIAAATIRKGIREIDAAYVNNFMAVVRSLDNPRQLRINLMLDDPRTGFGSTSYKGFEHSTLNWDPVVGKFERLRLPYGVLGEGMSIILPVLSDGSWEVTVTLEQELVDYFAADEEWAKYSA